MTYGKKFVCVGDKSFHYDLTLLPNYFILF